mmetsp:Transcript_70088/g.226802  ORF Transcript_70088/g.226802 Transcript_70088/m.226802 type:complete len:438 (-) Transcript_70088:96-1409(-)
MQAPVHSSRKREIFVPRSFRCSHSERGSTGTRSPSPPSRSPSSRRKTHGLKKRPLSSARATDERMHARKTREARGALWLSATGRESIQTAARLPLGSDEPSSSTPAGRSCSSNALCAFSAALISYCLSTFMALITASRPCSPSSRGNAKPPQRKFRSTPGGMRLCKPQVTDGGLPPESIGVDSGASTAALSCCACNCALCNHSRANRARSRSASTPRTQGRRAAELGIRRNTARLTTSAKSSTVAGVAPKPKSTRSGATASVSHAFQSTCAQRSASTARRRPGAVLPRVGTTVTDDSAVIASELIVLATLVQLPTSAAHRFAVTAALVRASSSCEEPACAAALPFRREASSSRASNAASQSCTARREKTSARCWSPCLARALRLVAPASTCAWALARAAVWSSPSRSATTVALPVAFCFPPLASARTAFRAAAARCS